MSTPVSSDRAIEVHRALLDLIRIYQFRDRDRVCCYDVSVAQSHALDRLRQLGPLSVNALAESLYIDKSTASRLVDGLETKGYVSRSRHDDDRRAQLVSITRSGERLSSRVEEDMIRGEAAVLGGFSPDEQATIARVLKDLAGAAASRVTFSRGVGTCS